MEVVQKTMQDGRDQHAHRHGEDDEVRAGVAAGLTGTLLAAALQNPWVLGSFALKRARGTASRALFLIAAASASSTTSAPSSPFTWMIGACTPSCPKLPTH